MNRRIFASHAAVTSGPAWLGLFIAGLAVGIGFVASTGPSALLVLTAGALAGSVALFVPERLFLAAGVALVLVLQGVMQYFFGISQAHWLGAVYFLAACLRTIVGAPNVRRTVSNDGVPLWWACMLLVYLWTIFASAIINNAHVSQFLVGVRQYVLPVGFALLVGKSICPINQMIRFGYAIPALLILQVPFVLYQFLVVAKTRVSGISWDAVVGTFGGNPDGGGASGALALFLSFGIATSLMLFSRGNARRGILSAGVVSALICLSLAEVKVAIVYVPTAIILWKRREVLRSPLYAASVGIAVAIFVPIILYIYKTLHWGSSGAYGEGILGYIEYAIRADAEVEFVNRLTGEMGRWTALVFWWRENVMSGDLVRTLIGHGPGSAKISATFGVGEVAGRYSVRLTTSSLSSMLWEIGVLGVCAFLLCLFACMIALHRLANERGRSPTVKTMAEICIFFLVMVILGLPYNMDVIDSSAIQLMLFGALGLCVRLAREPGIHSDRSASAMRHVE